MSDPCLNELSEGLDGTAAATAEEIFRAYEPYLRMVVRRQMTPRLRTRFDSRDVVQSVWSETLLRARDGQRQFRLPDPPRLRAFLVRLVLNRFIDFYRRHRTSLDRERSLSTVEERNIPATRSDRPSEVLQAGELWAHLLSICPPAHHDLLRMKTLGAPLAEIADRTGLHESSVRRILYDLAGRYEAGQAARSAC